MAKHMFVRKCYLCDGKGQKSIDLKNDEFVVIVKGKVKKFYHKKCYFEFLMEKGFSKDDANRICNEIYEKFKNASIEKDKFFEWLYKFYEASTFSSYFFQRVDEVISGVYKDLKEPISYTDLLEMYKRQSKKLDSLAISKQRKGKGFKDISHRALFDLAVIVGKYDSFKKWKMRNRLLAVEMEKESKEQESKQMINIIKTKKHKTKIDDVDLEELF